MVLLIGGIIFGIMWIFLLFGTFFRVKQQTFKVVERFGKYRKVCGPGLQVKIPLVDKVAGTGSLKIRESEIFVETKTKDNVFVVVKTSIQHQVIEEKRFEAFYKLQDPNEQMQSYVFDVIRAKVPSMLLDDVFEKKDDIAENVAKELQKTMKDYGYSIVKALVTDVEPDPTVKASMNEINAQERLRVAAKNKGEAEKILIVKAAEAEAESKKLQGEGIANQRRAIIDGLKDSVTDFASTVEGSDAQEVMTLVLLTQYFDTLKEIGGSSKSNVLLIPSSPDGLSDMASQIRNSILAVDRLREGEK